MLCDAWLSKKYFDNINKLNNKKNEKKNVSYMEDVYYVSSSLVFFFVQKKYIIKYFKNYGKL